MTRSPFRWLTSLVLLVTPLCCFFEQHAAAQPLRVDVIDVGLGDAILLSCPDGESFGLIDAGDSSKSYPTAQERLLEALRRRMRGKREFIAALNTHPHPDHIEGFLPLLQSGFSVLNYYDNGASFAEGDGEERLRVYLKSRGTGYKQVMAGEIEFCPRSAVRAELISLNRSEDQLLGCPANLNDCSLKLRIEYQGRSLLLLADATTRWDEVALANPAIRSRLRADVLKVGHHASHASTSSALLDAVSPDYVVVSVGRPGRGRSDVLGYPSASTVQRISAFLNRKRVRSHAAGTTQACQRRKDSCEWVALPRHEQFFSTADGGSVSIALSAEGVVVAHAPLAPSE